MNDTITDHALSDAEQKALTDHAVIQRATRDALEEAAMAFERAKLDHTEATHRLTQRARAAVEARGLAYPEYDVDLHASPPAVARRKEQP
jgi:hypothetical protein